MSLVAIWDQLVQMGQYAVVSRINTGDKVFDSTANVVAGSTISYVSSKAKNYAASWVSKRDKKLAKAKANKKKAKKTTSKRKYTAVAEDMLQDLSHRHRSYQPAQYSFRVGIENLELCDAWCAAIVAMYPEASVTDLRNKPGSHYLAQFASAPAATGSTEATAAAIFHNRPVWWCSPLSNTTVVASRSSTTGPLFFMSDSSDALRSWVRHFKPLLTAHPTALQHCNTTLSPVVVVPQQTQNVRQLFSGDLMKWQKEGHDLAGEMTNISRRWTLDCMVFRHKPELMGFLKRFEEGLKSTTPFSCQKMGLLLSSAPGCGKTSLVSALANRFQRDVLSVDLTQIDDKDLFAKAVNDATSKNAIILFDEFDLLLKNLLKESNSQRQRERQQQLRQIKENLATYKLMEASTEEVDAEKQRYTQLMKLSSKAPLDLAFLLSLLDGVGDSHGRIIVATTNHPELIPPALLRPGRFDLKIAMGHLNNQEVKDLLTLIFKDHDAPPSDLLRLQQEYTFPDDVWSPAEIICQYHVHGGLFAVADYLRDNRPILFPTPAADTTECVEGGDEQPCEVASKKRARTKSARFQPY